MGVVLQATGAQLGSGGVSAGATVFDGDQFRTNADGALRLRIGAAQVHLGGDSVVTLRRAEQGLQATLLGGTLSVSSAPPAASPAVDRSAVTPAVDRSAVTPATDRSAATPAIEIAVNGALLRTVDSRPAVAQVSVLGPKEFYVVVRRGALELSYNGESEVIPEGATYRAVLDPAPGLPSADQAPLPVRAAGRSRAKYKLYILIPVAWATGWAIHEVFESPNRP
ncbi:MAG: hypothetical protein LAN84_08550 [Acidobacteriia bacterium]|nr:hypothetical protein [Terriglobia bacterium]